MSEYFVLSIKICIFALDIRKNQQIINNLFLTCVNAYDVECNFN